MNIYHQITRQDCLSHQLWPHFKKGWPETDKNVHFFWGLGDNQTNKIREVSEKGEEWWYVDTGYLTQQITRYPSPKIHDIDKTYFRIIKGGLHTTRGKVGSGKRLKQLESKGIDVKFKGWYSGNTEHILVCPSSQTVTYNLDGVSQQQWIDNVVADLKQYTKREIRVRNKPRPNNEWWNKDIKEDLKNCHCLVTNLSLAAIDALLNKVPIITHNFNVCSPVSGRDLSKIEKPLKPGHKTIEEWLKFVAENQFTIPEIADGTAYKTLQEQQV